MIKYFQGDIFPFDIAIGDKLEDFAADLTSVDGSPLTDLKDYVGRTGLSFTATHNGYIYECVYLQDVDSLTVGTWAHEAFHIAQALLERVGVPFHQGENNETYAYTIGWVTDKIQQFVNERNNVQG